MLAFGLEILFALFLALSSLVANTMSECTMCASCDNPCNNPVPSPPTPSPPPPATIPACPPPPSSTSTGGTYYPSPPPPSRQSYPYPPPSYGASDNNPPENPGSFEAPPPPNPIVPYFPFYYHIPPPAADSGSGKPSGSLAFAFALLCASLCLS